jgi:monoamine oxidase
MARTGLFAHLRRLLAASHIAARTGQRPEEVLAARKARRGPTRRQFLGTTAGAAALLPLTGAGCGDNVPAPEGVVAIIGGGVAGLHCAVRLAEAGVDVTVYEASGRVGGRMFTGRDLFPDGQICELGGELIDTGHTVIQGLADDFGLTLDDLPAATAGLRAETFHFDGGVIAEKDIVAAFTPVAATMSTTVTTAEADDAEFERVDAMSIPEWLETEAGLADTSLIRRILEVAYNIEYGLEADEQSVFNMLYLIDYDEPDPFRIFGDSDEVFHIHEGNDRIPTGLAEQLGSDRIALEHVLTRVAVTTDGRYELAFENDVTVTADHVVFALPFTKLRQVDLADAQLSTEKRLMIDELGYGTNSKLMLGFTSRPWADPHDTSGSLFTDVGALQSTWDTSRGQDGASGILTNFNGGDRGLAVGEGTAEQRATEAVGWLETVWPGSQAAYRADSAVRQHWPTHPFTLASYGCYRPGQWAFWSTEGTREGNLHFCGEHTSLDFQGYMEGGAETGLLVAMEILGDLGLEPSQRAIQLAAPKLALPQATFQGGLFRGSRRRWRRNQRRALLRSR